MKVALGAIVAIGAAASGCAKAERSTPSPPPSTTTAPQPAPSAPDAAPGAEGPRASASREAEEACVDRWLAAQGLDEYGHPAGTMYAGGTPLFDERTGATRDRLEYVYGRQPRAREACRPKETR